MLFRWPAIAACAAFFFAGSAEAAPEVFRPGADRYISARAYYQSMRAEILDARGDLEGAREALKLALVYDPDSYWLSLKLAEVAWAIAERSTPPEAVGVASLGSGVSVPSVPERARAFAEAERFATRASQLAPKAAASWRVRGEIDAARGRADRAERMLRRAIALDPGGEEARRASIELAELWSLSGRGASAVALLARLVRADAARAEQSASRRLETVPGHASAAALLGMASRERDLDAVEGTLRAAIERWPDHVPAIVALGRVLAAGGRAEEGLMLLHRASDETSNEPSVLEWTGDARAALGDLEGAGTDWARSEGILVRQARTRVSGAAAQLDRVRKKRSP